MHIHTYVYIPQYIHMLFKVLSIRFHIDNETCRSSICPTTVQVNPKLDAVASCLRNVQLSCNILWVGANVTCCPMLSWDLEYSTIHTTDYLNGWIPICFQQLLARFLHQPVNVL